MNRHVCRAGIVLAVLSLGASADERSHGVCTPPVIRGYTPARSVERHGREAHWRSPVIVSSAGIAAARRSVDRDVRVQPRGTTRFWRLSAGARYTYHPKR